MKRIHGVTLTEDGQAQTDPQQAAVIKEIYRQYLAGKSLGGIADFLFQQGIPSPTEKARWSRTVIGHLRSNGLYADGIVPFHAFYAAQIEKDRRSNLDPDKGPPLRQSRLALYQPRRKRETRKPSCAIYSRNGAERCGPQNTQPECV